MKKLVKESMFEEEFIGNDVTTYLNKLFKPYNTNSTTNIRVIKDFEEPGENYDYEDIKAYAQYSFDGYPNIESLSLEVLMDFDENKTFQFWYDASPIITGDQTTLSPDHQPFDEIEEYIPDVMEYINVEIDKEFPDQDDY